MKVKILSFLCTYFLLTGCHAMDCDNTVSKGLDLDEKGLDFRIYSDTGKYWGEFVLYAVDHTVSYTNNSGIKFREDLKGLEYVWFDGGNQDGRLLLKWPNNEKAICIANIPHSYWLEIKKYSNQWDESDKFLP
ncbi:hypothetical protein [Agarilytica rhodophyticola]|uniref:hypothetical protein n=1 Tax=Agarilytica rhodophyticola TaxID=1737490 RepID=UPI000B347ED6|nr:hypothetical protein [Agarilytica rhodophyticola]